MQVAVLALQRPCCLCVANRRVDTMDTPAQSACSYIMRVTGMGTLNQRPTAILKIVHGTCTVDRVTQRVRQHFGVQLHQQLCFFEEIPPVDCSDLAVEPEYCSVDAQDVIDGIRKWLEIGNAGTRMHLVTATDVLFVDCARLPASSAHGTDSNVVFDVDRGWTTPPVPLSTTTTTNQFDADLQRPSKKPTRAKHHHDWALALRALWPMNILRCVLLLPARVIAASTEPRHPDGGNVRAGSPQRAYTCSAA